MVEISQFKLLKPVVVVGESNVNTQLLSFTHTVLKLLFKEYYKTLLSFLIEIKLFENCGFAGFLLNFIFTFTINLTRLTLKTDLIKLTCRSYYRIS